MTGELSNDEITALLESEHIGHMACSDEGKPYIVPMAYLFHEEILYGQTTDGKKVQMLRKNPQVCFQVEHIEPGQWKSAICWGTFEEMDFDDPSLKINPANEILELLTKNLALVQKRKGISIPYSFKDGIQPLTVNQKTSTLFRIIITEKTGRFHKDLD